MCGRVGCLLWCDLVQSFALYIYTGACLLCSDVAPPHPIHVRSMYMCLRSPIMLRVVGAVLSVWYFAHLSGGSMLRMVSRVANCRVALLLAEAPHVGYQQWLFLRFRRLCSSAC